MQVVVIEVYGDGLPDLTLLDVPGLPTEDKEEMHDLVQEMQKKVADDPDCLVVAIDWSVTWPHSPWPKLGSTAPALRSCHPECRSMHV